MWSKKRVMVMALTTLVILAFALAGCGPTATRESAEPAATEQEAIPTEPPEPEGPVTLVVGFELNEAVSMDPHATVETPGAIVDVSAYDSLTRISEDWTQPEPGLAERWDVSDDGLVYTFHLRPGVKFHSGKPLTAEDVKFSLRRLINKGSPPAWLAADWIEDIEVVDDLTVRITLQFPDAAYPMIVASPFYSILDSKTVMEHGGTDAEDAAETDQATAWLDQNSAGTGPFILKRWDHNVEIVLEANPDYWRGKPEIDKLIIRHVIDPTAGFQMVQRGDLDMLLRLNPDLVEQAKADPSLNVERLSNLDTFYWLMTCDPEVSEPLADKRVRQAMALAVDREGIVETALHGYGLLPPSVLPLGLQGVDPADRAPRDLEKARALLKEAGYEGGFEVTLAYPVSPVWEIVAAKVQSDMAEISVTVELEPADFSVLIPRAWGDRDIAWWLCDWLPDYVDASDWTQGFGLPDEARMPWVQRCENALPPALVEASETVLTEMDPAKRLEAVKEWQYEMMDFAYAWNLYQINEHVAMGKDVRGFVYIPFFYTYWGDLSIESTY